MRNKLAEVLYKNAVKNKNIYLVAADISPSGKLAYFRKKYPQRFINVGVAEQVMIGISAGLAIKKKKVFAYTIAAFSIYRPFEMIRDDLCYQNLTVTVIGMGAGSIYSSLGGTHLTQEDISIARSVPNLKILCPCDPLELELMLNYLCKNNIGPTYLRIGKTGEKNLTLNSPDKWRFGKIRKIFKGKNGKICFITFGPISRLAFDINEKVKEKITIYNSHTLKPFDEKNCKKILKKFKKIIIIEDHSEIGGLYQIVSRVAFESKYTGTIQNFSLKDKFIHKYGSQKYLLNLHGISEEKILKSLNEKN